MRALFSAQVLYFLQKIQHELEFQSWSMHPQFNSNQGLGRVALVACVLGCALGIHALALLFIILHKTGFLLADDNIPWLSSSRSQLLIQWCAYVTFVCIFHLAEFFVTAYCNPTVVSADSFIVNHSHTYTAAAILSACEFFTRFFFFPQINSNLIMFVGLSIVIVAQAIRTTAIATCGESFNHLIQTSKKDNHALITHGIYKYLRHPSYVGFFYWAIGTQLVLCNPLLVVIFAVASWMFFQQRIPYEEESLRHHFPDVYSNYAARTWIGIPFIKT